MSKQNALPQGRHIGFAQDSLCIRIPKPEPRDLAAIRLASWGPDLAEHLPFDHRDGDAHAACVAL